MFLNLSSNNLASFFSPGDPGPRFPNLLCLELDNNKLQDLSSVGRPPSSDNGKPGTPSPS